MRLVAAADVRGLVHMTGGGFPENIPRVVPKGLAARIARSSWEVPPLFQWVQEVSVRWRRRRRQGWWWGLAARLECCMEDSRVGWPWCIPTHPCCSPPTHPLLLPPHPACTHPAGWRPCIHACCVQAGKVPDSEMFRTFNMGVGMVIVVPRSDVDKVLGLGLGAWVMGEVVEGQGVELV